MRRVLLVPPVRPMQVAGISSLGSRMVGRAPHIVVRIETKAPIEVDDFAAIYTALGSQYRRFIQEYYPDVGDDASIYVEKVRKGSILVELAPWVLSTWAAVPDQMRRVDIIVEFVKKYGHILGVYFKPGGRVPDVSRSDLQDFSKQVAAIANDPNGSAVIEAAVFEDGKKRIKAAFKFRTPQAQQAVNEIESHRLALERISGAQHKRVIMTFRQANVKNTAVGKRTGERVVIEEISDRELPLVYSSELAEDRIKAEIRDAQDNLFHKGFVVDVNVATRNGRAFAYRVTDVHQVIDMPDDESSASSAIPA